LTEEILFPEKLKEIKTVCQEDEKPLYVY